MLNILYAADAVDSPRLTGGGSRTDDRSFVDKSSLQDTEMCCRGPAVVKAPLPRSVCPAELEDKLATYGASTKQLVGIENRTSCSCEERLCMQNVR